VTYFRSSPANDAMASLAKPFDVSDSLSPIQYLSTDLAWSAALVIGFAIMRTSLSGLSSLPSLPRNRMK
jgi:hypothetical protein